jgi:16S rRNA (adenine1518-N6/adenine1519-N6)-dimethyltransferase
MKIAPKKSLGQHFLRSEKALNTIVEDISPDTEEIFEIGPGEGVLTEKLLQLGKKVTAIEIDKRSIEHLKEKFELEIAQGKFNIIEKDCLEVQYKGNYTLLGNIPYYITGAIFRQALEQKELPKEIIFLVQKEVAQRVVARDGKESILSVSIKIFSEDVSILDIVKKGSFVPPPKVDSAIISIKEIQSPFKNQGEYEKFFKIVKAVFSSKRKFALSNLKNVLGEEYKTRLSSFIEEKQRAEDISIETWNKIIQII